MNAEKLKEYKVIAVKLVSISLIIIGVVYVYLNPKAKIEDGHIIRSYNQIMKFLEDAPADIRSERYESTIPEIVQKDIEMMLQSDGKLDIMYVDSNKTSYIQIKKDDTSETGIKFVLVEKDNSYTEIELITNVSMYKRGQSIVIYGSEFLCRSLEAYDIINGSIDSLYIGDRCIDLYGTGLDYDVIETFDSEMTMVRNGNEFMFYRLGEQVGKTEYFPGGEITEFNYSYILDDKQDMYYLYYSCNPENLWIKFVKVDSNVSKVTDELIQMNINEYRHIAFLIYEKNGSQYVGVSDADTECAYGVGYGNNITVF